MQFEGDIREAFEAAGVRAAAVPLARVRETVQEMAALFASGRLEAGFAAHFAGRFRADWEPGDRAARSAVLLAVPSPAFTLTFPWRGGTRRVTLPSGYAYREVENGTERLARRVLEGNGFSCGWLQGAPMKLLAVRSGLCRYGRNNIAYCEGLGSAVRLYGFLTDLEVPGDTPWHEPRRMPECESCSACAQACPTGCIGGDGPVIRADRCLTYLNENGGDFPGWVPPFAHNAVVGCMVCQRVCPMNRGKLEMRTVENAFDEDDIEKILAGGAFDALPEKTQKALRALNLDDYWGGQALTRNLNALLAAKP